MKFPLLLQAAAIVCVFFPGKMKEGRDVLTVEN